MKPTLNNLVKGFIAANGDIPSTPIKNIQLHSGNVQPGDLYIAIHGTASDGHDYIPEALENGASAIITNGRDVGSLPVPQVKVSNPRKAASLLLLNITGIRQKNYTLLALPERMVKPAQQHSLHPY